MAHLVLTTDSRCSQHHQLQGESVLTPTDDGVYKPKTKETCTAYEAMLSVINMQLGGQPLSIDSDQPLRIDANKILAVLKNDRLENPEKKKDIEKILDCIPNQVFNQLVSFGKFITDFQDGGLDDDDVVSIQTRDMISNLTILVFTS